MRGNHSILRTSNVHVFKYNVTNAHRILRMMHDERTPYQTRRALKSALKRLAACTDIDKRQYLKVENVAILLRIGITYQEGSLWQKARRAHSDLWDAFNERDRVEHPQKWAEFDAIMLAYVKRLEAKQRPPARRAKHTRSIPPAPVVQRLAA